jgi:hypothetical protein
MKGNSEESSMNYPLLRNVGGRPRVYGDDLSELRACAKPR